MIRHNYCFSCQTTTAHEWVQIPAPEELRTHGHLTETVGWLRCIACERKKEKI
jgi:hypothetical protein